MEIGRPGSDTESVGGIRRKPRLRGKQQPVNIRERMCTLTGPDGGQIELPYSLFEAFEKLEGGTGCIEIEVRDGEVALVRTQTPLE